MRTHKKTLTVVLVSSFSQIQLTVQKFKCTFHSLLSSAVCITCGLCDLANKCDRKICETLPSEYDISYWLIATLQIEHGRTICATLPSEYDRKISIVKLL